MGKLLAYYTLRILAVLGQRLPVDLALKLGECIGIFAYCVVPKRRRIAMENLRPALGDQYTEKGLRQIMWRMSLNMGRGFMEFLRLPIINMKYINHYIKFVGEEHLKKVLAKGKGAFVLTAHFGNFDLCAGVISFKGYPVNLVTKYLRSDVLNELWLDFRRKIKINPLFREGSLREIVRHLRNNEIMGFVLDQNTRREEGVFVNFFGRPASTIPGLATLVQRLKVPVVSCFMIRKKGPYHRIVFEPALYFENVGTVQENIVHNTQIYTDVTERYVRAHPDHWIWIHRRWKTKPLT